MATDVARLALQIDVTGAKRAQQALRGLQDGSVRLTQVTNQQAVAMSGLRGRLTSLRQGFRLQKGAVQQAGYQIGDFAVQVGAGQSALVAFSQQASQLAGVLGPGGAVVGAVIAIGAAVAMPFVRSMGAGEEATKSFTERLQELRDATDELTDAQVRQLKLEFKAANRERLKQITAEKENIAELREEQERYQRLIDDPTARNRQARETGVTVTVTDLRKRLKELDGQIDESRANIDTYTLAADNAAQELDELIEGTDKTGDSSEKAAEKIREMVEAAEQQAATIGLSARATATYEAALAGANAEQILAIDQAYQRIEASKAEQEQAKEAAKQEQSLAQMRAQSDPAMAEFNRYADQVDQIEQFNITTAEKERLREEAFRQHQANMSQIAGSGSQSLLDTQQSYANAREQIDQRILSSASSLAGSIAGTVAQLAGEQSGAYRAAFIAQQAFAVATSIINTQMAAAAALAPPPIGLGPVAGAPYAAAIEGLGMANVGVIAAQTLVGVGKSYAEESYLGGGYTGRGSRSGGVDGKGGFPAILHPNETVIDHELGQRSSNTSNVNQTIVMNVSGDVTAQTRKEIMKAMPMIRQQAKSVVLSESQNGGAMSRAMGRRS